MKIEDIARCCHEINRDFCMFQGDYSQDPWESAPDWQRESAIKGVKFRLKNPDAPYSTSHESWLSEKRKTGWIYGSEKNVEKKIHPCMVPFDELPLEQQAKDKLFCTVVDGLKHLLEE
jgi:hypothetical protein